ncbi:YopX family protein [Bacteroides nordii]|uniref:YopX family protein n=1 Tax=Bacteroides nordii TaxID=291645 RepID=UPI00203CAC58|nr:YopX family protein [Bacteroides nordii]GFZ38976.1 phage protein [Bacteroides nordii]
MRIITFRGKRTDTGEWAYGSLIKFDIGYVITISEPTESNDSLDENNSIIFSADEIAVVNPNSVGQFTGLLDRKGKQIYEGDIVQLDYITTIGKHCIGLSFEVEWCTQEGYWVGWDGFTGNTLQQTNKMFVVKGNIYDNPELINE